jgi:hypothetical protein
MNSNRATIPNLLGCLAVLLSLLAVGGRGEAIENDLVRGFVGPVREVITTMAESITTELFDRDGLVLEMVTRTMPPADQPELGEQVQKLVYSYDDQGRRVRELIDDEGQQYVSRLIAYDEASRETAEAAYHMCGTFSSLKIFQYDAAGRLQDILLFQFRSLVRQTFRYDGDGRMAARHNFKNGQLQTITRYRYDAGGRTIEETESAPDGSPLTTAAFEYDRQGNRIREQVVDHHDPTQDSKTAISYEYDSTGNWTKRTRRRSSSTEVTERRIAYY